jgi:rubrerythrin
MSSEEIFISALRYEKKIRNFYFSADIIVDDERGKKIFGALANNEQSHIDFLEYCLDILKAQGQIDITKLESFIPSKELFNDKIEKMRKKIPERIFGDVKRVLNSALKLEIEISKFYQDVYKKTEDPIKEIFKKLLEIEQRHEDVVQIQLEHA